MTMSPESPLFVHLRSHSEFSVVDGIARIPDLINQAKAFGQPAMAITDLCNLFGWVKFYKTARKAGIKPIVGADVWLENTQDVDKPFRILLLATDHAAYLALCELLSRAWIDNSSRGRAEIRREWLIGHTGLIILSGGRAGDVGQALEAGRLDEARRLARLWAADFPGNYFIELQRAGFDGDEVYVQAALRLAADCGLPVVATHPIQFIAADDFRAHEARVCIADGELLGNPRRIKRFTPDQYLTDSSDMAQRFADVPSALSNTVRIAQRCNLSLTLGHPELPLFPTPDGVTLDDYMVRLANEGLQRRMLQLYDDPAERAQQMPAYQERLDLECQTIVGMGFPGYFLIVQDFINWGKGHGVPVGPGRGSGAGSLVAYSLGITDLDPLCYDLLFERFLNPERVSMPDFDIDFCQDNRERVIEYVKEKYGRDAVSQIATFGTLGAKAVVRDVGRVLEMPYSVCDNLSKMIPFNPADPWSLERTLANEPAFRERYDTDEEIRALIDLARPLEGLTRNIGMHAGGVIIARGKLTDYTPLYCQPGNETSVVSQYDKNDVEDVGLVKFDFLGLRNLTILDWAVRYVREFNPDQRDFDIMSLPLDDAATYALLSSANTTAVFQLESRGMKELLKSMQPNTFEDVIALLALFRPGPLESGMVVDFVNRKHGRAEVDYFHPDLEPVLKSTYGVIVYQEQVMLISQIIGGYSLGGADLLRRAMGKKKPEEMAKHRVVFQEGAVKKGYDADLAAHLFDLMEKFAGYGFNKSHSAAYALISYQTAWLKHYHPAEFLAATMLSDMDDTDKVQIFWRDAVDNGVAVLPPDVNASGYRFAPVADEHTAQGRPPRTIRYGLGGVKGTGQGAVEAILAARQAGGPFASLFDFCARVDRHAVNRRTIEALIRAGAFDLLEDNRAALLATLGSAIEAAEQAERNANQGSLFDNDSDQLVAGELARVTPWDLQTYLTEEKAALGFYFSGHLFEAWRDEIRRVAPTPLARLAPSRGQQWLAGVLAAVRPRMTKRGKMLYALLDDGTAQIEIAIFNELYEQYRLSLKEDRPLVIQGRVSHDEYSGGLRVSADDLYDLQRVRETRARSLRLSVPAELDLVRLTALLAPWRSVDAGVPVELSLQRAGFACQLRLGEDWRVRMDDALIASARQWLSYDQVEVFYG
ncbi:DNA polymerase III subunit alpha [Castellaniella sp.]|uniref:DNA polymerase III subunit alpha n=1 Tax=Castellaniella sp. TaxID=1955812 RepID=UPI002AFFE192|nr:DNA polymerase III subunit alpha [Castellaniella sp.]